MCRALSLLRLTALRTSDLAWLNIAKVRDVSSANITERIARTDYDWLKRQLAMMGPEVFIVLGTNAARYQFVADFILAKYGAERIGIRGQRGSGESLEEIAARILRWRSRFQ